MPLRFGDDSFFPHLASARALGIKPTIIRLPGIALDIDQPGDVRAFLRAEPPMETRAAVQDALAGGIRLLVTVAEGVPVHDAIAIGRAVRRAGATWIGASSPGMAIPG